MSSSRSAIQTYTGVFFDPFNPDPSLVDVRDIAHSLANQCRFSGHTKQFWSVAAHSCLVSALCPEPHKLQGLLHDATEFAVVDLPRPIKKHPSFQMYRDLEAGVRLAIATKFGLDYVLPNDVHEADLIALWAEAEELLHGTSGWVDDRPIGYRADTAIAQCVIRDMLSLDPEKLFLDQFFILTGGDVYA